MWATLQGPELSQGGLQELFADQTPLWCRLGENLWLLKETESLANILLPFSSSRCLDGDLHPSPGTLKGKVSTANGTSYKGSKRGEINALPKRDSWQSPAPPPTPSPGMNGLS